MLRLSLIDSYERAGMVVALVLFAPVIQGCLQGCPLYERVGERGSGRLWRMEKEWTFVEFCCVRDMFIDLPEFWLFYQFCIWSILGRSSFQIASCSEQPDRIPHIYRDTFTCTTLFTNKVACLTSSLSPGRIIGKIVIFQTWEVSHPRQVYLEKTTIAQKVSCVLQPGSCS